MEGITTRRGNVYSFGIEVMDTFTKKKPTNEMFVVKMNLKQCVVNSLLANAMVEVVDTNLLETKEDDFVSKGECLSSVIRLVVACCGESPEEKINIQEALATLNKIKNKFLKDVIVGGVVLNRRLVDGYIVFLILDHGEPPSYVPWHQRFATAKLYSICYR